MALQGIDISGWQAGIDLSKVPCDFVFIKATGGVSYVSNECDRQYQQAKKLGKLIGIYHFANDDNKGSSPEAEADFFVKNTLGYHDGKTILVLDFEAQALQFGASWAKRWMDRVCSITKIKPIIYLMGSACQEAQYSVIAKADYGLWIANWGSNAGGSYRTPAKVGSGVWPFYICHQYTSNGQLSGYNGRLDLNIFHGDAKTWYAYAAKNGNVVKPSSPKPSKSIEELAKEVLAGKHGNGDARRKSLGANYVKVQQKVNEILYGKKKSIEELAKEVLAGKHGNGDARRKSLGSDYSKVQKRVDEILAAKTSPSKTNLDNIARQVYIGNYGNEPERSKRLRAEGYDPAEVQRRVNEIYY